MCLMKGKTTKEKKALSETFVFDKSFYYVREAAEMSGIDKNKIYRAIHEKKLPHAFKHGFYALHIDDIKEYEKSLKTIVA